MQSALQAYYVLMAGYGWYQLVASRRSPTGHRRAGRCAHLLTLLLMAVLSLSTAHWLSARRMRRGPIWTP